MSNPSGDEKNYFVRVLIVIFCLLLSAMVLYNYVCVSPKGELNAGVITLLAFLLVLVLAESFDNFSVGKLLAVSREAKRKEAKVAKLENEKAELLKQLISISTSQSQNQSHTNVYGDYHAPPTVKRASEEELSEKESNEEEAEEKPTPSQKRLHFRDLEAKAVDKYMSLKGVHKANFIPEAKLVTQFHGIDPVSNHQPIFDGYYKDDDQVEIFVEFRPSHGMHMMYRDRIYLMLSKVERYRKAKNVSAHLELVWLKVNLPEYAERQRSTERMLSDFEPAIASGLLRISELTFEENEVQDILSVEG